MAIVIVWRQWVFQKAMQKRCLLSMSANSQSYAPSAFHQIKLYINVLMIHTMIDIKKTSGSLFRKGTKYSLGQSQPMIESIDSDADIIWFRFAFLINTLCILENTATFKFYWSCMITIKINMERFQINVQKGEYFQKRLNLH